MFVSLVTLLICCKLGLPGGWVLCLGCFGLWLWLCAFVLVYLGGFNLDWYVLYVCCGGDLLFMMLQVCAAVDCGC